jgi:hypothetical protein
MAPTAGQGPPKATTTAPPAQRDAPPRSRSNSAADSAQDDAPDVREGSDRAPDSDGDDPDAAEGLGDDHTGAQGRSTGEVGSDRHGDDSSVTETPDNVRKVEAPTRPLTSDQVQTLRLEGNLPEGKLAPAVAPARYEPTPAMTSNGVIRIVGVPATQEHLDAGIHTQNGYGGLEALLPMESLSVGDIARLDDFFQPTDNPHDVLLVPRSEPLQESELDVQMRSLDLRREVASIITEFNVPSLAQRVIGTVSLLRRLAIDRQLIQAQLGQDNNTSARDAVQARSEIVRLELALKVQAEQFNRQLQTLTSNRKYTSQEFKEDIRVLMTEHEHNIAGLKEQVASLTSDLDDAMVHRQSLERQLQQARFDAGEVMNYLADQSQVMMHWPRLLDLLKHLQDGTPVPSASNTMITVTVLDDPTAAPGAYVRQQRSDDEETKESGPPASAIDLTGDTASESSRGISSKRRRSSGSQGSVSKRASLQAPEAPDTIQEFPSDWDETSCEGCRAASDTLLLSESRARALLADFPIAWDDLRLDVQMLMRHGVLYPGALEWLGEDRVAHKCFHMDPLIEMLVRMMYWGRLDSVFWTKYVPRRYFKAARSKIDELREADIEPPYWGELQLQIEDEIDPEANLPEPDDKAKDGDWDAKDESLDAEVEELLDDSPSKRTRKRSKLQQSKSKFKRTSLSSQTTPSKSTLVKKNFEDLTLQEMTIIEKPDQETCSWLHYGVRTKRSDKSAKAPFQTPGFPGYAPNRHDFALLYERFEWNVYKALLDEKPWKVMFEGRVTRLYFHHLSDLSKKDRAGIQEWLAFMQEKARALWEWLHWVTFQPDESSSEALIIEHAERISRHDALQKAVDTKIRKLKRKGMSESLFDEPGLWTFLVKVCYWIWMHQQHIDPSTGEPFTLPAQLELLDHTEPARVQWMGCTDEQMIAHLPAEVRGRLIPPFECDEIPCAL